MWQIGGDFDNNFDLLWGCPALFKMYLLIFLSMMQPNHRGTHNTLMQLLLTNYNPTQPYWFYEPIISAWHFIANRAMY